MSSSTTPNYTELSAIPNLMQQYRAAAKDLIPGLGTARSAVADPSSAFEVHNVSVDINHLAEYTRTTGLRLSNELPLTYPYVLSFPLAMKVMASPDFPFQAVGVIHLNNVIEQTRPLRVEDTLDIKVHAENLRPHPKGLLIDMVTTISVEGEVVWTQTSGFLSKGAKLSSRADKQVSDRAADDGRLLSAKELSDPTPAVTWSVSPSKIKSYATASGDKNPIHVSALGAKAFGFPSTIAHGMWSAAALLSSLEGLIPSAARYTIEFAKPITLPAKVALFHESDGSEGWTVQLRKASKLETLHASAAIEKL